MNTPTPAQALGECLRMLPTCGPDSAEAFAEACAALIKQHGQHFAGLCCELERARARISELESELSRVQG